MKNTNIEKRLEAKGDLSEKEKLIKLASESASEEKELSFTVEYIRNLIYQI